MERCSAAANIYAFLRKRLLQKGELFLQVYMHFVLHLQTNSLVGLVGLYRLLYFCIGKLPCNCKYHGENLKLNSGVKSDKFRVILIVEEFFDFHSRCYENRGTRACCVIP